MFQRTHLHATKTSERGIGSLEQIRKIPGDNAHMNKIIEMVNF